MTARSQRRRELEWFAGVALVTLLAYARSLTTAFQFDDHAVLRAQAEGQLSSLEGFLGFARTRVLPFATFALNYWVGGEDPLGYHAVNLTVHLAATFIVYQLALALCATPRVRTSWLAEQRLPFAVITALVFACHPIQVQAVTYVVQRAASMAAMFYVGAVLLYVRARNAQLGFGPGRPITAYAGCVVMALAAFLSKENTASLPLAIVLAEWAFFGGQDLPRRIAWLAPFFLLVLVIPLGWSLLGTAPGQSVNASSSLPGQVRGVLHLLVFRANPAGDVSPLEYFLTQCVVIPRYLALVALPWGLNVDHDVPVERGLTPAVAGAAAFLAILFAFGLHAVRRWPVAGFGIVWCFVTLSVESTVLPIHDVMVEHRMYLALPGIALVAGVGFAWAYTRRRQLAASLGVAVVGALLTLTFMRNAVWQTPLTLWSDALEKSPDKARVRVNYGVALERAGRRGEAIRQYCKALELEPQNAQARLNLDAAVEEEAEEMMEDGAIALEAITIAPDGKAVGLAPRDPCRDP